MIVGLSLNIQVMGSVYYMHGRPLDCLGVMHQNHSYKFHVQDSLSIVSHEAKKKQAVCDEQVSYLQVAPL